MRGRPDSGSSRFIPGKPVTPTSEIFPSTIPFAGQSKVFSQLELSPAGGQRDLNESWTNAAGQAGVLNDMAISKAARWLDLLAYLLQHRFPVSREQIFEHVRGYDGGSDATRRQRFERDKRDLKALGVELMTRSIPHEAGSEQAIGYRLRGTGVYLPYFELLDQPETDRPYRGLARMSLSAEELALLDRATRRLSQQPGTPLAEPAAGVRRKLGFDLPFAADAAERVLAVPIPDEGRRALAVLQGATSERAAVRCRYYSIGRDEESTREIEPYGLMFQWSHWYAVGRARDRDAVRVFRVDRMKSAERLTGPEAQFDPPATFDIREYMDRAPWELGEGPAVDAVVRLEFPDWIWVRNRGLARINPEGGDRGPAVAEMAVRDEAAFLRWALTMGSRVTIERPHSMARKLDLLRQQVAALYTDGTK